MSKKIIGYDFVLLAVPKHEGMKDENLIANATYECATFAKIEHMTDAKHVAILGERLTTAMAEKLNFERK